MKKLKLKHIKEYQEAKLTQENLFEMANFGTKTTGLPMIVWVSEKRASHAARIKVARDYNPRVQVGDTFSVLVSDEPKVVAGTVGKITSTDLKKVFEWVKLNKDILLKYWNHELLTDELLTVVKKVK